ncbi:MAG: DUF4260 family protein [Gemmatimonadales bacterium]|nr:DUF4260 family protein [Gemmatimonadales bacterium]NIN12040.1 DUF4260 family protein [Gemmatimonadales bacterium]NIR03275.1 DUF4260 family protein [Gemmatimonadales bacterium]NIS66955.1 DUF4260 family protein [Gemmatimonadales bacterium]
MNRDPTSPAILLHVEGAAVLVVSLLLYREVGASWWMFVLLILAPDLSILGYLAGSRVGAVTYNVVHTYALPAVLFAAGFITEAGLMMGIALIWGAHIGVDRLLGFGLKYPAGFRPTHLQRVIDSN